MAIHAVILPEENSKVVDLINEHYPFNYSINDQCFLVRTEQISERVATILGFTDINGVEEGAHGAVLKLNGAHSGLAAPGLWEWLASRNEK